MGIRSTRFIAGFAVGSTVLCGAISCVIYAFSWPGYINRFNVGPVCEYITPPSYPGDDKITGQLCNMEFHSGDKAMRMKPGCEPLPEGSMYDWVSGKVMLPHENFSPTHKRKEMAGK